MTRRCAGTGSAGAQSIPPGSSIRVRIGPGRDRPQDVPLGTPRPIFENVKRRRGIGDGGYLFDRHGDLRAWRMYRPGSSASRADARRAA